MLATEPGDAMTRENPHSWQVPIWHPDLDGEFEFASLRTFALAVIADSDLDVKLAILDEGYVHLDAFRGGTRIGLVYVNRGDDPDRPQYSAYAGADGDELHTTDIAEAVQFLAARRTAFPVDPD